MSIDKSHSAKFLKGFLALTKDEVLELVDDIMISNSPLYRLKKDGARVIVPVDRFDQFLGDHTSDITFYLEEGWRRHFPGKSKTPVSEHVSPHSESVKKHDHDDDLEDKAYIKKLKCVSEMSLEDRKQNVLKNVMVINNINSRNQKFNMETIAATVDAFTETLCINKTSLEENIEDPLEEVYLKDLVKKTHIMVNSLISMLEKGKVSFKEMAQLDHVQTGSNTLNHMNRILIRFIAFLFYYNRYFQTDKIKRVRSDFEKKFYSYYNKIVKGEQRINLEIVFKGGIHPIESKSRFLEFCVGALVHDIGKVPKIMYHDGSGAYDVKSARMHVFESYNMILKSKSFTIGEATMGLLHHEYYGAPYGYNQTETLRKKMSHKVKIKKVEAPLKFFISYDIDDILDGTAMSYFPNKVMEILDVYDSLTDKEKKYRPKQNTPKEAVMIMRNEFLEGAHLGIDPVLFNIFVDFLQESGIIMDHDDLELLKI